MPLEGASPPQHAALMSVQARYACRAAEACGYAFRSLDGRDGYLFEVRDGARAATFAAGAGTPYALNDTRAASIARDKAFCAEVLRGAGISVLPGAKFFVTKRWAEMRSPGRELDNARAYVASVDLPVFCKPLSASNGLYAEVIESVAAFDEYVARVASEHFAVLVQPFVRAPEYRVFVLNGRALFSYRKRAPQVVGDGRRTLAELVEAAQDAGSVFLRPRGRNAQGRLLSATDTPSDGDIIVLEGPANRAAGGGADGLRDGAPKEMARIAIASAHAVGLSLAAVDLFDLDGALTVIEVNSNPMIATLEEADRWDLIIEIWRANFDAALR